jgi:cell division protein FtsW
MARKLKSDTLLFVATLVLLAISLAWVYSATAVTAERSGADAEYYLTRQAMWIAMGMFGLLVAMTIDYHLLLNRRLLTGLVGVTLVALVAVFFCEARNNSHRWLGVARLGVQPSEFAKLVAVIVVAFVFGRRLEERGPIEPGLFKVGLVLAAFVGLIVFEPDYGGAMVLLAVAGTVLFVAGLPYKWVLGTVLTAPWLAWALLVLARYRRDRLLAFLDPWADRQGKGFQTVQAWIAVGTGGVWGKGFMQGVQQMFYLPEAHNDFIYAVISEEKGLVGSVAVLLCFAVIVWRGLVAARRAPDAFGSLLAVGLTVLIGLQALLNISVVLNLVPAKGISLPFVSSGGSSMLTSLAAMGILLNISQQASATE